MPTPLLIGSTPTNLSLPAGARGAVVEHDMFDICDRVKASHPRVRINLLETDDKHCYAVMEHGEDGVERLIFKVAELDQRVLDRLDFIMSVPRAERVAAIEKEIAADMAARAEDDKEQLYDKLGGFFYDGLHRHGFTGVPNPRSVTPLGATARRHGRRI